VRENASAQETIRRLDLNYYIPCTVQKRVVAVLDCEKPMEGDFLSSEDVAAYWKTLAGYLGIAIQNARLYASLEQKSASTKRLQDFNENIVEIHQRRRAGCRPRRRIESWNSQMEVMYALPRFGSHRQTHQRGVLHQLRGRVLPRPSRTPVSTISISSGLGTHAGDTRVA